MSITIDESDYSIPEDITAVEKDTGISVQAISSLASTKYIFDLDFEDDFLQKLFDLPRTSFVRDGPSFTDESRFQSSVMQNVINPLLTKFFNDFSMPLLKFSDNVAPDCVIVNGDVLHFIIEIKASPTETGRKRGQTTKEMLTKQITQLIEYMMKSLATDKYEFARSVTGIVLNVESLTLIDLALNGKKIKSVKAIKVGLPKGNNKVKYDRLLCLFYFLLHAVNEDSRDEDGLLVVEDLPLKVIPFNVAAPPHLHSEEKRKASTSAEEQPSKKYKKDEKK